MSISLVKTPPMPRDTRIVYRETGHGWATVTIGGVLQPKKVRTGSDALARISATCKAQGAQGVGWGVCGTGLWVGFSW